MEVLHRGGFALALLLAALSGLTGCGGVPFVPSACSGCEFVYATATSGQVLALQAQRTAMFGAGSAHPIPGPANSTGIAVGIDPYGVGPGYLYVSDPQDDAIRVYTISTLTGELAPASVGPYPFPPGGRHAGADGGHRGRALRCRLERGDRGLSDEPGRIAFRRAGLALCRRSGVVAFVFGRPLSLRGEQRRRKTAAFPLFNSAPMER